MTPIHKAFDTTLTRRVLVTGAGRGIGFSIARLLARDGFGLVLLTATEASAVRLRAEPFVRDNGAEVIAFDLAEPAQVAAFVDGWKSQLWGIVHNAGVCETAPITDSTDDPWQHVLSVNLEAPYRLTRGLLPHLTRPGRIVTIGSQLSFEGRAGYGAYCASKFGLIGLTKCWAKELGSEGVTANAICPGWVDTEMTVADVDRLAGEHGRDVAEFKAEIASPLELKRFNTPDEVAELVAFLMSDKSSGVTGRAWLMQTVWNQE
jgi:NAD(P)-dependent dehydrogenase (short-subunit alcohol dehydrogenase family)